MNANELTEIDRQLEDRGERTVKKFLADASAFNRRHNSHAVVFERHLHDWELSGFDATLLNLNIRTILESKRNELAMRQFRCDGTKERLQKTLIDIEANVAPNYDDHIRQVILVLELLEWCTAYTELVGAPQTH